MEKISRIIPPSARTQGYEAGKSGQGRLTLPNRAPSNGGIESNKSQSEPSVNAVEDRMTISDQLVTPILNGDTMPTPTVSATETYKPKDVVKSQMVKEMTNRFFAKQNQEKAIGERPQMRQEDSPLVSSSSTISIVKPDSSKEATL